MVIAPPPLDGMLELGRQSTDLIVAVFPALIPCCAGGQRIAKTVKVGCEWGGRSRNIVDDSTIVGVGEWCCRDCG